MPHSNITRGLAEVEDSEHLTTMLFPRPPDPASDPTPVAANRQDFHAVSKGGPRPRPEIRQPPEDMGAVVWANTEVLWAGLSPRGFMSYMALASYTNSSNRDPNACWPSVETLAKRLGISTRQVQRALRELEVAGFVMVEERQGTSNVYHLVNRRWPPKGDRVRHKNTQASPTTPDKSVTVPLTNLSPTSDRDVMPPPTEMSPELKEMKKGDKEEKKGSSSIPGGPTAATVNVTSAASLSSSVLEELQVVWDASGVDKNKARLNMLRGWKESTDDELTAVDWLAMEAQRADENQRKTYGSLSIGWSISKITSGERAPEEFYSDRALERVCRHLDLDVREIIPDAILAKRERVYSVTCQDCHSYPPTILLLNWDREPAEALANWSCHECGGHRPEWT